MNLFRFKRARREQEADPPKPQGGIPELPRFEVVQDPARIAAAFERLIGFMESRWRQEKRQNPPGFQLEKGQLPGKRRYLYLAPWHQPGLLFEMTVSGWLASRAQKSPDQTSFIRSANLFEQAILLSEVGNKDSCLRVSSRLLGEKNHTISIYLAELMEKLPLTPGEL